MISYPYYYYAVLIVILYFFFIKKSTKVIDEEIDQLQKLNRVRQLKKFELRLRSKTD